MNQKHVQTKLVEPMLTQNWPKGHHKIAHKKYNVSFYDVEQQTTNGIFQKIDELMPDHKPVVAWSGGKDGMTVLDKTLKIKKEPDVFYIRTNTGVQKTEDFVKDQCQSMGLRLHIREPTPWKHIYVAVVLEIGFPGPELHDMIMRVLKYETMWKFHTEPMFKNKKCVFYSGIRQEESERRKFNYSHPINVDSGRMWFTCPAFYMTTEEVYKYILLNKLPISEVHKKGKGSLECNCGSFPAMGAMEVIRELDPKRAEWFEDLTWFVKKWGTDHAKRHSNWGSYDWTKEEVNEVMTKYFDPKLLEHMKIISNQTCGAECGPGTMRGLLAN